MSSKIRTLSNLSRSSTAGQKRKAPAATTSRFDFSASKGHSLAEEASTPAAAAAAAAGSSSSSTPSSPHRTLAADTQIGNTVFHTMSVGDGLVRAMQSAHAKGGKAAKLGSTSHLSSISKKMVGAIGGKKDTALDKQLAAKARQKQQSGVPMTPEVRLQAYEKREPIRPERGLTCPNGHKLSTPTVKKALTDRDVYTCTVEGCGAMCGGEDVHPLHLQINFLNPADKHKYVDSVRWLSKSEVEVQTREYIKGHPLVFPHLAEGILFNDETDAWLGWVLGWNIYYWHNDIASYWRKIRQQLEAKHGALDEDEEEEAAGEEQRGRGKRRKPNLLLQQQQREEEEAAEAEEDEEAQLKAAIEASLKEQKSSAAGATTEMKSSMAAPAADSEPAAAASSSSSAAAPSSSSSSAREVIDLE